MSSYELVRLNELLKRDLESNIDRILKSFQCKRDKEREDFLHNKAIAFEKKEMARTYIAFQNNLASDFE